MSCRHAPVLACFFFALLTASCRGPHLRSKAVDTKTYQATARCSQGPLDAHFVGQGARWGESIEIRSCGPRNIRANARIEVDGQFLGTGPIGWSEASLDNQRCVLRDVEQRVVSPPSREADAPTGQGRGDAALAESSSSQAPGTDTPVFRDTGFPARACPDGDVTVMHLDRVRKGADIRVKVWSDQPNDFEGAVIQIRQRVYWPSVSEREWEKHVARREEKAWKRAQRRHAADKHQPVASAEVDTGPQGAPPAPRREIVPPKVSVHAEWVPGYWHWVDTNWLWIAGDWRVPADDVQYGRTLQARYPPPAARFEAIPDAPGAGFLWTPGYWTWNRGRYLWIAGVWRLSPTRGAIWKNHSWRVSGSGAIFVPGGWRD